MLRQELVGVRVMSLLEFFKQIWLQIAGGILLLLLLSWFTFLRKKIRTKLRIYATSNKLARKYLRELKKTKREHPVARYLMYRVAKGTGIHLFGPEGEDVSLEEYGSILYGSIESLEDVLKEIYLIELTGPSIWYPDIQQSREMAQLSQVARRYFDLQKKLKHDRGDVIIKRYIILSKKEIEEDDKSQEFMKEHKDSDIDLYYCPPYKVRKEIKDTAIFFDRNEMGWAIRSLNFDRETLRNPSNWIRVQIQDDQSLLQNYYRNLIQEVISFAKPFPEKPNKSSDE